jgi:predicted DNA repair protein MutK
MAGGLVGLFDDVAALAKLAASSIDDVGAAAGRASMKAAGVVVDDAAVTPQYVQGLAAERELPIIKKIARGSLLNKLAFILPAAVLLSEIAPTLVEIILICGGSFLAYEGAHKILHALAGDDHDYDVPVAMVGPEAEAATVTGAVRTDFILSAEIMVISLKEVIDEPLVTRGIILAIVAVLITVVVYGAVALIVKMDDVGLRMAQSDSESSQRTGRSLVAAMPKVLKTLSVVGTAAMLWVGGHILLVGAEELGWHFPYDAVHDAEYAVADLPLGGLIGWSVNTLISAVVGFFWGLIVVGAVASLPRERHPAEPDDAPAGHH